MLEVSLQDSALILLPLLIFLGIFFTILYLKIRSLKTEKAIQKKMHHEIKAQTYENFIKAKLKTQSNQINQHLKNKE